MCKRIIAALILATAAALLCGGCGSSETTHVPDPGADDTLFADLEFGSAATFDVVTWNIENFTNEYDANPTERERYVVAAVKAFDADVIALQEITSSTSFQRVLADLDGWDGYRANIYWGSQQLAYLWNTQTVTVTSAPYHILTFDSSAFPRRPLVLECTYAGQPLLIINNHFKCCGNNVIDFTDEDDEEMRRLSASTQLEQWIRTNYPGAAVILLGDLNDRLTDAPDANVFNVFLDEPEQYVFADMSLATGSSSYWSYGYGSHIDHIMVTNELFVPLADPASEVVTFRMDDYLQTGWNEYETNLSDHLPVGMKLPLGP